QSRRPTPNKVRVSVLPSCRIMVGSGLPLFITTAKVLAKRRGVRGEAPLFNPSSRPARPQIPKTTRQLNTENLKLKTPPHPSLQRNRLTFAHRNFTLTSVRWP